MASLSFRIKGKVGEVPILVRFRPNRDTEISGVSNLKIKSEYWDSKTGFPDDKKTSLKGLTAKLWKLKDTILDQYKIDVGEKPIDKQWLDILLSNGNAVQNNSNEPPKKLIEYFDYFLERRKSELTFRSYQKYKIIKGNVELYQKLTNKEIKISDVGFMFSENFKSVLLNQGYAANTVERAVTFVKTVCRHANKHGLKLSNDFLDITTKNHKVTWPFLTFEELDKIRNFDFPNDYLQNAADWLIISCFTGQRVSDFMRFKKSMILEEYINGKEAKMLDIVQEKTKTQVYVPILPPVQEILDRRNGEFPRAISDQKYNNYIKEVCHMAGINEVVFGTRRSPENGKNEKGSFPKSDLVSSHIGRRSFATNFYTQGGYDLRDIMEITGHTSEKTFLLYIGKKKKSGARGFFKAYSDATL